MRRAETMHRGLRAIGRRLGVSKDTVARWAASWGLPVFSVPYKSHRRGTYFMPESLARVWEFRRAAEMQADLRNDISPNPLRYRRGRCPHCKVLLQRFAVRSLPEFPERKGRRMPEQERKDCPTREEAGRIGQRMECDSQTTPGEVT